MTGGDRKTFRVWIRTGALHGFRAWTAYAAVECLLATVVPLLFGQDYSDTAARRRFSLLLFGCYAAIGVVTGGVIGGISFAAIQAGRRLRERSCEPAQLFSLLGVLTVVVAFGANLLVSVPHTLLVFWGDLALAGLLTAAIAGSVLSPARAARLALLTVPWTASALLLGSAWAADQAFFGRSAPAMAVAGLCLLAGVLGLALLVHKVMDRGSSRAALLAHTGAALLVLAVSLFADRSSLPFTAQAAQPARNAPNVILIVMDTVRADHLSVYGYERDTTPNLRALASEAFVYSSAIAPSDITLSSHASLFTGMYATRHGAHYGGVPLGQPLSTEARTLAEILEGRGLETIGVAANHGVLGEYFGLNQGFRYWDRREPIPLQGRILPHYLVNRAGRLLARRAPTFAPGTVYRKASDVNRAVFPLLEELKQKELRFFLFLNYMDAHVPYTPPPPFDRRYPGKMETFRWGGYYRTADEVMRFERDLTEEERLHLMSQYDGAIAYLDDQLGKMIARLKQLGLYENLLLIVTSDHGEALGRRNLMGHGVSVYQDQVFVPLIVKYPNAAGRQPIDRPASGVDVMPTILDVFGLEIPDEVDGESLLGPAHGRPLVSESFPDESLIRLHKRFRRVQRALFSAPFKMIASTNGVRNLYHLENDPDETVDLCSADSQVCADLSQQLGEWLKQAAARPVSLSKPDSETLRRLKSLGYLQ